MTAEGAGQYLHKSRRFILREIKSGRLKAARIGGRGEILTTAQWCDSYVEAMSTPVLVSRRRS
jgi:hypothetical protein